MEEIFETLRAEHERLLELTGALIESGRDDLVLGELRRSFWTHRRAEEDMVYPLLETDPEVGGVIRQAYVRQHLMGVLLREADQAPTGAPEFRARMEVLSDLLRDHADVQEAAVFLRGRQVIGARQQVALTEALAQRRRTAA